MGKLYVVGTPIGNLEDITLRALRVLGEVDIIAAEDTRRTRKLLSHYKIRVPLLSYRRENEIAEARRIAEKINDGKNVAIVTDAGMPGLSDPGFAVVAECTTRGLEIEVVPGPSSLTTLLAVSAVPVSSFLFEGYLPSKRAARRARLIEIASEPKPVVFFEAPHRIKAALEDIADLLPSRALVLGKELTKLHEEIKRGTADVILKELGQSETRGEYVVMITAEDNAERESVAGVQLAREVQQLLDEGVARNDAFKMAATKWGVSRNAVYQAYLEHH